MKDNEQIMQEFDSREESYWLYSGRLVILERLLRGFLHEGDRLLNVGCGPGATSRLAESLGAEVVSFDFSLEALRFTRNRGLKNLVRGDSLRLPFRDSGFDALLCLDVAEHIEDDRQVAKELLRMLRPGRGKLLLSVPADRWQWTSRDVVFGHYRRYTTRSLVKLLQGAGFRLDFITHFNSILFPLALIDIVLDRFRAPLKEENCYPGFSGPLNRIFHSIFSFERNLLPRPGFPFGKSLICLCTRPE